MESLGALLGRLVLAVSFFTVGFSYRAASFDVMPIPGQPKSSNRTRWVDEGLATSTLCSHLGGLNSLHGSLLVG